ncbi:hypothetical protein JB92DRAFT_2920657 [Gautieria morchelliformis]|nr:hypothetical protein JB92DRAFT_2920657 [Gautieria morchelliformis]
MEAPLSTQPAYMLAPVTAVHPPDLETDDPSLATEVLPAPPPLASIVGQRRDSHLRRPTQVFSYLPASDPGTTYSGLMGGLGLVLVPEEESRLRKRARTEKTVINSRAHRASARGLNPNVAHVLLSPPEASTSDSIIEQGESRPAPRRTNSLITISDEATPDGTASNGIVTSKNRDKGKGKEKAPPRVKEEPQSVSLDMLEPSATHQPNDDHCSSCRFHGGLLYCDGCPRSFHLWCLDPPLDAQDVPEGDNRWYCPACVIRQNPPPKPRRSLISPLLHQLQMTIPTEFELPEDIRGFFKDVATGPKGSYQDVTESKLTRASRFAIIEERDPFRLKDKNGAPVLCFRCGKSALPDSEPSSGQSSSPTNGRETRSLRSTLRTFPGQKLWKSTVSCDHCSLHWHLDCLDPPLSSMPAAHKKWMCPAHVEHIAPKRRVPKQVPPVTDITGRNRPNNGNIEIIPADNTVENSKRMSVDEVHINGRRYRVPERVIVLDFWDKLGHGRRPQPPSGLLSGLSSPLTSLSSLDGIEPLNLPSGSQPPSSGDTDSGSELLSPDLEVLDAVKLLIACRTAFVRHGGGDRMDVDPGSGGKNDVAVQTDPEGCVKLDVSDAKQLSGLISATLQDLDFPGSPTGSSAQAKPYHTPTTRIANILRPARSNPRRFRKSSRLPTDSGSSRVTRSKAAPSRLSAASTPGHPSKSVPSDSSTQTHATRASRSLAETSMVAPSTVPTISSPIENRRTVRTLTSSPIQVIQNSHSATESPTRRRPCTSPVASAKTEPSVITPLPAPPSNTTKSPFKIRIPRAINTAVAAATAAAASGPASSSTPRSNGHSRSIRRGVSSSSDSSLSSAPFITRTTRAKKGDTSRPNGFGISGLQSPPF